MNQQTNLQDNNQFTQNLKIIWVFIVAVVITALLVGGGVYWWQNLLKKELSENLENKVQVLEQTINELEGKIDELIAYCKGDVEITYRLYEYGKENGLQIMGLIKNNWNQH